MVLDMRAIAALLLTPCLAFNDVIELDLYRALKRLDVKHEIANDDMADLVGVLQYLHTKVIVEHSDADTEKNKGEVGDERMSRLNSIDTIVRVRTRVKNPAILVSGHFATQVDFGPAVQFVDGEATGAVYKWDYGDFVGAKRQISPRFETDEPYYWFAFSGFCPNLPFSLKLNMNKTGPNEQCVWYKDGSRPLDGGLCINGTHPGVQPNGLPGCVYTYEPPTGNRIVSLDDIVGITREDCAGRPCKDWLDFRSSCTNKEYKRKFQYSRRRRYHGPKTVSTDVCVEYDIHPDCMHDCSSHQCKQIPAKDRELGLPFWRGRCDKEANRLRVEQMAAIFGIPGASDKHEVVDQEVRERAATCVSQYRTECLPAPDFGGMYCTRQWAGVCQPCYIPGTFKPYEKAATTPYCPWDILETPDYATKPKGRCLTNLPSELCCIFQKSCNATMSSSPASAPLDDNGYQLVAAQRSTDAMETFLTRVVTEGYGGEVTDPDGLKDFAYNQWGPSPLRGRNLAEILRDMAPYIKLPPSTLPPEETTTTTTTTTVAVSDVKPAPVVETQTSGGFPWWGWLLVGVLVLSCCLLAGVLFMSFGKDDEKRKSKKSKGKAGKKGKGKKKKARHGESGSESGSESDRSNPSPSSVRDAATVPLMSTSSGAAVAPVVAAPAMVQQYTLVQPAPVAVAPVGSAHGVPISPTALVASAPPRLLYRAV